MPAVKYIDREWLETPREGYCMVKRWWVYKDGLGLAFWGTPHTGWRPQCHSDRALAECIRQGLYPDAELVYIPVAYLGHDYGPRS